MRIIGGTHRGQTLTALGKGDAAAHLRPTSDRVREAIFNLLINGGYGDPVAGARVLDLFAGTGALGLEALSRGAAHATFIDTGATARALTFENIRKLKAEDRCTLIRADATRPGDNPGPAYNLIFLDPPYGKALGEAALLACHSSGWLAPSALIVWEESAPPLPPPGFERLDQRRYGDTWITIARAPA